MTGRNIISLIQIISTKFFKEYMMSLFCSVIKYKEVMNLTVISLFTAKQEKKN